jgi:hypothetical protein
MMKKSMKMNDMEEMKGLKAEISKKMFGKPKKVKKPSKNKAKPGFKVEIEKEEE